MMYINDSDVWYDVPLDYLWIYDKLILARKLGYKCGPAGVRVPSANWYIVRPITNIRMMSKGAEKVWLTPEEDSIPDGFFWCEIFQGRHISVDFHYGEQHLAVEGFRDDPDRLDRFSMWKKIDDRFKFPSILGDLYLKTPWINVEYVDGNIIEVHLRWNDDFTNHTSSEIYPVWKDDLKDPPEGCSWYPSGAGDRMGFWIKN